MSERRSERKVVTVLFCDLVGFTSRAETLDPEDVAALLAPYHARLREELERFGGTVEKFIGDAVMALFGAPLAHEDDPERAVRAALAIRDHASEEEIEVRIGISTGEALVTLGARPEAGEPMAAGDVVNTAARLQGAAPVNGILVGERTYEATRHAIDYAETEPVVAKGKAEPVAVWEAREARARLGVDVGGQGRAPLVGRDEELAVLAGALNRARRERSTQLVTVVGVPGIGKSRLLYELGRIADEDEELITWKQGRSLPYGEGVSFWAFGEIVKAQAGILESDNADDAAGKLGQTVGAVVPDTGQAAWVERHLRPLVGLGGDDTAGDLRGEAFAAWRRFVEGIADSGPTVLLLEDLHWADDGLLDFVDGLVDWIDGVPLLVVCTARPELLERRPDWGGGKRNATTLSLAPLDEIATKRLVAALLERPVLDADAQQKLVARAAGNPLYAEEFVRMLDVRGVGDESLPDTVQGIVAARIDLLPAEEKDLLKHAAVLGKVFWSDALATLSGVERWRLAELLRSLERKEFVRREHRSVVAGEEQHAFVHALVRDAAYSQLARQDRAERHLAAASWIESLPADRSEDRAEMLAHHYLTALELLQAAGRDTSEIGRRAIQPLHEAADRALSLHAYPQAAQYVRAALDLLPEDEEPSPEFLFTVGRALGTTERGGLDELDRAVAGFEAAGELERGAEAAIWTARHVWWAEAGVASAPWLERASRLLEGRGVSRAKALLLGELARIEMLEGRSEEAHRLANEAIALAVNFGDLEIEADALVTRGTVASMLGESSAIEQLERAVELVGGQGPVASRAYVNLSVAAESFGDARLVLEYIEKALRVDERLGDERAAMFVRDGLAWALLVTGAWDEALALVQELRDVPNQWAWILASGDSIESSIRAAREPDFNHLDALQVEVERAREIMDPGVAVIWVALFAMVAARAGQHEEAATALDEVLGSSNTQAPFSTYINASLVLALLGRQDEIRPLAAALPSGPMGPVCQALASRDFARAADVLDEAGYVTQAAEVRMDAARALAAEGRLAEAQQQLERARAFYREVGAVAYLRQADEILTAAS